MSRVSVTNDSKSDEVTEVTSQLITIRDYIYEYLEEAIERENMQNVESELNELVKNIDPDIILEVASRLIGGNPKLKSGDKKKAIIQFDKDADLKEYMEILRKLIYDYNLDISYVTREMKKAEQLTNRQK
ncbi:hypothetical protein QUF90_04390 [Desulfococcaceae bacterium HSG9]|nr:hypothetical protein [Desulfococcaceae bacterium HSG9]